MIKTVGIVGHGNFGQFLGLLATTFFPEVQVKTFSRRSAPDHKIFFSLEETAASDVVILCGAISEYKSQLELVLEHVGPETVIVDVATVKKYTGELLKRLCKNNLYISTHPMFGPESYLKQSKKVDGFRIVVTDSTLGQDEYHSAKQILSNLGFIIVEMTADEHDKQLAETLFLTHYVAQSIITAGFERTNMDTVSFHYLMDAVESVKGDTKLFADVYEFNPYCKDVAERLHGAQQRVFTSIQQS